MWELETVFFLSETFFRQSCVALSDIENCFGLGKVSYQSLTACAVVTMFTTQSLILSKTWETGTDNMLHNKAVINQNSFLLIGNHLSKGRNCASIDVHIHTHSTILSGTEAEHLCSLFKRPPSESSGVGRKTARNRVQRRGERERMKKLHTLRSRRRFCLSMYIHPFFLGYFSTSIITLIV